MSARPEIERLTAAGETAADIARIASLSIRYVHAVRRELRQRAEYGALHALAAEEIPVRPAAVWTPAGRRPWTEQEQARHRAELLAALRGAA